MPQEDARKRIIRDRMRTRKKMGISRPRKKKKETWEDVVRTTTTPEQKAGRRKLAEKVKKARQRGNIGFPH